MSALFWSSAQGTMFGLGDTNKFNPGLGAERYERAKRWLGDTGRSHAFASFSFDPKDASSVVIAPEIVDRDRPPTEGPSPSGRVVDDGRTDWEEGFRTALETLGVGGLEKVVLARQVDLEFETTVSVSTLLARLVAGNPSTYVFSIDGLVGACPELLVRVDRRVVSSLVLAGTARRPEELDSDKIVREHQHASDSVRHVLAHHADGLTGTRSVLEFGEIKHVGTRFEASLRPGVGVLDLVAELHPNPSVCGTPADDALHLIRTIEPRARQRYAGPVGWFDDQGNGEFSLALRCGMIEGSKATLYSGGGLVVGSEMATEWDETELKLGPMLRGLGVLDD